MLSIQFKCENDGCQSEHGTFETTEVSDFVVRCDVCGESEDVTNP